MSFRKWKKSLENIAFYIKIIYNTPSLILITIFSNSNFPKKHNRIGGIAYRIRSY